MPLSPSCLSVWEDESVRADSPEPEQPFGVTRSVYVDPEARENVMVGKGGVSDGSAGRLLSPQGKGLGIVMGTLGSLCDRDGLLKEI